MYKQIAANKRRTVLLMAIFVILVLVIGYGIGAASGDIIFGLTVAAIVSVGMSFFSYYKSDQIALLTSGAKLIEKRDNPELWNLVENLAITAGVPMPRVAIIRDPALNAFATGRNPEHAIVAVTTGLLERLTRPELEGVISHELSHIKNYDILVMTVVIVLVGTLALLADMMRFGGFRAGNGNGGRQGNVLMIIALVLLILSPLIGQLIKLAVNRQREYLADASGALLTRYPEGLASALEKIGTDTHSLKRANHATAHLFISDPFKKGFLQRAFSTHPPVAERIKRLRAM